MTKTKLRRGLLAAAAAALVLAACGSDKKSSGGATTTAGGSATTTAGGSATSAAGAVDLKGKTVNISGSETGTEADGTIAGFAGFEAATGAKVEYTGTRDFETQIRVAAEGGNLPNIALFPQPGLAKQLADKAAALPPEVLAALSKDYDKFFIDLMTVNGKSIGVPTKADLKSLVWYNPKIFKEKGYEIPKTWDELIALQDKAKADGIAPWCVGIESGDATGWPFTDWMEDIMLRMYGPDVYDKWVTNEVKFTDPQVKAVAEEVGKIWFTDGNVLDGRQSIPSTGFGAAGLPVATGKCLMHRQGNFYAANFKAANPATTFGPDGDVNVFYLPTMGDKFGDVTLVAGQYAVAFDDKPETVAMMKYLSSPDYSNNRIKANKGGFLSPNKSTDTSLYADEIDRTMNDILIAANPVRFDASDQMPGEVGSGAFWKDGTNYVNGTESVDEFLKNVQAAWPTS